MKYNDGKECTGLVYRYRESVYVGKKGNLVQHHELIPMKSKSCKCKICDSLINFLNDWICEGDNFPMNKSIETLHSGSLYKVIIRDWDEENLLIDLEEVK